MVSIKTIVIYSSAMLYIASCSNKNKNESAETRETAETADTLEVYIPENVPEKSFSNIKEMTYIPDCAVYQDINIDNIEYYEGGSGYDDIKCLDHNVSKKDQFVAYSHRVQSNEPTFESFGTKFRAERIVNIVAPIEIKAQRPGADRFTARLTDVLIEKAFPKEYWVSRNDGSGHYSLQKTADAWQKETRTASETEYLSQGIAIFPWNSNDNYVQYCILTHSNEGGNSDMPEIKFIFASRNNTASRLAETFGDITDLNMSFEVQQLAQKYLSLTLEAEYGEPFHGQLDFRYPWNTPYITYEEDGICAWFPKGTAFNGAGIVPVKIPMSELRPYLKEGQIGYWGNMSKNWRTYPMLSSYGEFE